MTVREGQRLLAVVVPEAVPIVARWRADHGITAPPRMPPHVTVFFDLEITVGLREIFSRFDPFDAEFSRVGRFTRVMYLEPEPAEPFIQLAEAVPARPSREFVPHLTLGRIGNPNVQGLPFKTLVTEVTLFRFNGRTWDEEDVFMLGRR